MSFLHSMKFRFTIWYLLVLAVLLTTLSVGVYSHMARTLHRGLDASLRVRATQLRSLPAIYDSIRQGELREELGEVVALYFYVDGQLVKVSPGGLSIPVSEEFISQAIAGTRLLATVQMPEGERLRLLAVPLSLALPGPPHTSEAATLVIARSTKQLDQALNRLARTLVIAVLLALAVAAGGGIFLARRALQPVDRIAQTAREIGESDLSRRIDVDSQDELGRLAATLNGMIARLEQAFQRQQQFTSDASHELRTPLAVIEAEATLALRRDRPADDYRQSLEIISEESRHMAAIIDQLLTLARADAGKEQWHFTNVDLGKLIDNLSTDVRVLCQEKGLAIQVGQMQELTVRGDEAGLRKLFMNLFDNAIRYTSAPGTVSVSMDCQGPMAVVTVADTGSGIPSEEIPFIFDRFYRVGKSRSQPEGGSGLGLAICRHIAEAHGAEIEVDSLVGAGSTFSVRLPLQSS